MLASRFIDMFSDRNVKDRKNQFSKQVFKRPVFKNIFAFMIYCFKKSARDHIY